MKRIPKQECIPVGCVPPAAVAIGGSTSVHAGIHPPGVGLETPPGCGHGDPPWPDPSTSPLGVGLETPHPPGQTPQLPP